MEPSSDPSQAFPPPAADSPPPASPTSIPSMPSTPSSRASRKSTLSLDLSNIPALTTPAQPSNTLLFTGLVNPDIFLPDNLQTIRDLVAAIAPLHSWSPLRSFRRVVASFYDVEAAIRVRDIWNGEAVLGEKCRVYFGKPTPVDPDRDAMHLALPDAGKLFFISPPPSPPHGWEMRLEDAPNKMVHAEDLADALAKLRHHAPADAAEAMSPVSPADRGDRPDPVGGPRQQRSRSSTLIYQPSDHGGSPGLPAIAVEDMTDAPEVEAQETADARPILAHTARPPVELMNDA